MRLSLNASRRPSRASSRPGSKSGPRATGNRTGRTAETATDRAGRRDCTTEAAARLRHLDQRYTPGRRAIIALLVDAGHPVSIGDIADASPTCPTARPTATSSDLQDAGLVRRVAANDEFAALRIGRGPHRAPPPSALHGLRRGHRLHPHRGLRATMTRTVDRLAADEGFQPHSHRLDVLGLCSDCR